MLAQNTHSVLTTHTPSKTHIILLTSYFNGISVRA